MSFAIRYTARAREDLLRLYDYLLDRSESVADFVHADAALEAIERAVSTLAYTPFVCRKVGKSPFLRELLVPFGRAGYVALFEIEDAKTVTILAVRHQLEDDYH